MLVLQGGGALGSYQAGAYQALCHFGFDPEWVAGISIGAVNAAIIAGNEPEKRVARLKEFWELVSAPVPWKPLINGDHGRSVFNEASAALIATFGVPGFFTPRIPPAPLWPPGRPEAQSYYDTAPLKRTLGAAGRFRPRQRSEMPAQRRRGQRHYGQFPLFRQRRIRASAQAIGPEHIMASGALPPGFPAIVIDGEHYWDGGISSNTPLDYVLDAEVNRDLLIFQVDLFSARGMLPATLLEAAEREKDIRFSSRTRMNTDKNRQIHNARRAVRDLVGKLPDHLKDDPSVKLLREASKENTVTVVHLIYKSKNYETSSKDYDFSHVGDGRALERRHARRAPVDAHKDWLERPRSGETMVTYDLIGDGTQTLHDKPE